MKQIDFCLNFPLTSDWYYGLTGKNVPAWILLTLPRLSPGFALRKLAESIDEVPEEEMDEYYDVDDEMMAQKLLNKLDINN